MSGKKKGVAADADPEVAARVAELRAAGDRHFLNKEFKEALASYEEGIKLLGDGPGKAALLLPSAGCYMQEKRYREAVKACTAVLEQSPHSSPALKTRAKANEHLGFLKQALADVQAINKGEAASAETRDMERRLQHATAANKAKLAAAPAAARAERPISHMVSVKATLDDTTKVVQASLIVTYAELLEAIKAQFPDAGPFVLKYTDKEGDVITITSRHDIESYLSEMILQYQRQMRSAQAPKLGASLPPLRVQVVRVGSEAEVPKPPADEVKGGAETTKEASQEQTPRLDPEDWLVEFARIFSETTGIDSVSHHELTTLGSEKLSKTMELTDEGEAEALFGKASTHFQEAACASFIQWGNVHVIKGDRLAQAVLKAEGKLEGKAVDPVLKEYDEAEKKYQEALKIKSDSWEAHGALGQLEWERTKIKLGYVVPAPAVEDPATALSSPRNGEGDKEDSREDVTAAIQEALSKIDPKKAGQVQKHVDAANKWFEIALGHAKASEERKKQEEKAEADKAAATGSEGAAANGDKKAEEAPASEQQQSQLHTPVGNILVMHGNVQYEWSQVLAAANKEWKPVLDSAVAKFRASGAAEADIRGALKAHTRKDDLDLGPDPEPEQPAAQEEVKEAKSPAPEAKGLPSLEVKMKAKAAASRH